MRLPLRELKWLRKAAADANRPLDALVRRRQQGEPLQYIIGTQPFGPLELSVRPPILIPRPETEHWVIELAARIPESARHLLDLGTGSGCIPLLLAHLCPALSAHAVDVNPAAVTLATENAARCSVTRFRAFQANFLDPDFHVHAMLCPPYDVLTSNPPYIPWNEYLELPDEVKNYEDPRALFGGPSGLEFYHAIARLAVRERFLSSDAIIALEVGHDQAEAVGAIFESVSLRTEAWTDPWGKKRTIIAYRGT
ncbi:S-adenosyl-L-methionine-dependent methyltransferase [Dendrothele bispora CBS 962.96]|uniref:peptide chain release factor N(5)-glutamine methyltransferase n=1 Tax=Dendrothele bispora (strain CBS 962.96) TaxID=1314807 RepID=A0A4S8MI77_DENBC|nr:S-adenosyl-L-methionine-dependent methyltransferase [Dendrothele bispora CBS 962.96]